MRTYSFVYDSFNDQHRLMFRDEGDRPNCWYLEPGVPPFDQKDVDMLAHVVEALNAFGRA